jgi:hypothetical protein
MPIVVDRRKMIRTVEQRLAETDDGKLRHNLEVLLRHMEGEIAADIDLLISTLSPECEYRFYGAPPETQPRGHDDVRTFYAARAADGHLYFEYEIEHLVVDPEAIVTDGVMTMILPARSMSNYGVDDDGSFYSMITRMLILWPFQPDGLLRGEDAFSTLLSLDKLAPEDVPADLRAASENGTLS